MSAIDTFRGEHWFLSNFSPSRIVIMGVAFPTVEHAFQALKADQLSDACLVARAPSPAAAKKMGHEIALRGDWEEVKLEVMFFCLRLKFKDPSLRAKLLATAGSELVEGNTWGDTYWGVCDGCGHNYLGKLLMRLREKYSRRAAQSVRGEDDHDHA